MELWINFCVLLMFIMLQISAFASSSSTCSSKMIPFLHDLQLQCPNTIMYSWPIEKKPSVIIVVPSKMLTFQFSTRSCQDEEMNGESLDKVLSSSEMNGYVAILFYASSCPFSMNVRPKFDALSSMFPQIKHAMVEQFSVPPIVFSRHGIHGVPSIIILNRTTRMRHNGPKDLHSLVNFYQKATGLEPVMDLTEDQIVFSENKSKILESHNKSQLKNIVSEEPYLIFSLFFIFLKALLYLYPNMVSKLICLWLAYIPHLNRSIFGESRQLLGRVLHLVDFQRVFSKLNISRSAREWSSSFASFSWSKSSSSRASQGGKN